MAEKKEERKGREKKYVYGPGERSNLEQAFDDILPCWLDSEYNRGEKGEKPAPQSPKSSSS